MTQHYGQEDFTGYSGQPDFVMFNKNHPLTAFVGADNFAAENHGKDVSFTIGADITIQPDGSPEPQDIGGQRGLIAYTELLALQNHMIPAVTGGAPGKLHRHHQVTPEEALALQDTFGIALGMAKIAQDNKLDQVAELAQDVTPK